MNLIARQRLVLTLLDALCGKVGNLDFQKLLFLYTQQCEAEPSYEFVPYRFGAFSFTTYADKRKLTSSGLLTEDDQHWELTEAGRRSARRDALNPLRVAGFCRQHAHLRGNALIAEQYGKYPYYATRSEILTSILPDEQSRRRVTEARPAKLPPGLVTLGYEGRSLESYLNLLLRNSVTILCDVRRNPVSRKYGFAKGTLGKACEGVGLHYEHLPELGIDSEERRELKTQSDYDALFADYKRAALPRQTEALHKILAWVAQGERVALTCYELQPCQCHRHCVAEAVQSLSSGKYRAQHL